MDELLHLVTTAPDVIGFLRSQVGAKRVAESDDPRTSVDKPKSKPPLNVDALDAADLELATLAFWGGVCGVAHEGFVWRDRGGRVRGILYDDARPAVSLSRGFRKLLVSGWVPPVGMVEDVRSVRGKHLAAFPGLVSVVGVPAVEASVEPVLFEV